MEKKFYLFCLILLIFNLRGAIKESDKFYQFIIIKSSIRNDLDRFFAKLASLNDKFVMVLHAKDDHKKATINFDDEIPETVFDEYFANISAQINCSLRIEKISDQKTILIEINREASFGFNY